MTTTQGWALAQDGMALVDSHEGEIWKKNADEAILKLAYVGNPFTAEDVRALAGGPRHPNAMGARLCANMRRGIIRKVGMRHPVRYSSHASLIGVWVGVNSAVLKSDDHLKVLLIKLRDAYRADAGEDSDDRAIVELLAEVEAVLR